MNFWSKILQLYFGEIWTLSSIFIETPSLGKLSPKAKELCLPWFCDQSDHSPRLNTIQGLRAQLTQSNGYLNATLAC